MFNIFKKKNNTNTFSDTDMVLFQKGDKFYYTDRDIWHVIDVVKDGDDRLVIIKSWSKYKKRWCYKAEHIEVLAWWLSGRPSGCNQVSKNKDKNGYYHIKANKFF